MCFKTRLFRWALAAALLCGGAAKSLAAQQYPIVITSADDLARFGIEIAKTDADGNLTASRFPHTCYKYDHRGVIAGLPIAISDALLNRYKAKGFTRETLCMALVSRARFNPETGKRLPTYIFRDDKEIAARFEQSFETNAEDSAIVPALFASKAALKDAIARFKAGNVKGLSEDQLKWLANGSPFTFEQPLAVPSCFKNGTPYKDCRWKAGLTSGKSLGSDRVRLIGTLSAAYERQFTDAIRSGKPLAFSKPGESGAFLEPLVWKEQITDGLYEGQPESAQVTEELIGKDGSTVWFDTGAAFPRGYAYAFNAMLDGDPGASVDAVLAAFDGDKNSGKFDTDKILEAVEEASDD